MSEACEHEDSRWEMVECLVCNRCNSIIKTTLAPRHATSMWIGNRPEHGAFHWAECSCGWRRPDRPSAELASDDSDSHKEAEEP